LGLVWFEHVIALVAWEANCLISKFLPLADAALPHSLSIRLRWDNIVLVPTFGDKG
jgi:hypothetical protein